MEEKERKKKLEIQQKEEEERQREIAELKAGKFRKKTKEGKREPDSRESVDKVSSEEGKQTEVVTGNTEEVNKNTTEE